MKLKFCKACQYYIGGTERNIICCNCPDEEKVIGRECMKLNNGVKVVVDCPIDNPYFN